jgi:translocation and assembly module TamA
MAQSVVAQEKDNVVKAVTPVPVNISIEGLDQPETKNVLFYLGIEKNKDNPLLTESWLKKLHAQAENNIKQALRPFGYYQVTVESSLIKGGDDVWQARYQVKAGERVQFTKIDVMIHGAGSTDPEVLSILKQFPIQQNDFLNHEVYETAKDELLNSIGQLGYSDVKTENKQLLIDPQTNSAQINLQINTGEKYYLGQFRFHQNSLQPDFLQRYVMDHNQGDPFSQKNLLSIQQSLISSGYFSVVDIKPEYEDAEDQHVPIDITLTPANRHKLSFALGYDTEIDLNASVRWQNRLINSYGHNSEVLLKVSQKKSQLRGTYWIPINDPRTDKIGFTTKFETEETDDTDRETLDLEAAWVFKWLDDWDAKLFSEYKFERFESENTPETMTRLISIGARLEGLFIEKDNTYPKKGWAAFAELRGAPEIIWSDTDYLRLHLKSRILFPVKEKGRLILRGELGLAEVGDFDKYPNSLRFFAGGDQSVRGYDWKSLGPVDDEGDVIGGKNIFTASLEYNYKVSEKWIAASFIDAGNAYNNHFDKLYYGAGIGARWISRVGLIRADMGWPVNPDDEETSLSSMVFYFGFEVSL